jgi:hypothetical protein
MDDLPELKSDADVDALMARLRAKVAAKSPPPPRSDAATHEPASQDDAIEEELASVIARAMQVMADTLDDLEAEVRSVRPATRSIRARKTAARRKRR